MSKALFLAVFVGVAISGCGGIAYEDATERPEGQRASEPDAGPDLCSRPTEVPDYDPRKPNAGYYKDARGRMLMCPDGTVGFCADPSGDVWCCTSICSDVWKRTCGTSFPKACEGVR